MQALWSIYITIVLGTLGFLGAAKLKPPRLLVLAPLFVAFFAFACVNCGALRNVTDQRNITKELIRTFQAPADSKAPLDPHIQEEILRSLDPASVLAVTWFHVTGDILTLLAMAAIAFRESRPGN